MQSVLSVKLHYLSFSHGEDFASSGHNKCVAKLANSWNSFKMQVITMWVPAITVISLGNFSRSLVKGSATLITLWFCMNLCTDWQADLQEKSLWSWMCTKRAFFSDWRSVQVNRNTTKAYHQLCYSSLSKDSPFKVRSSLRYSFTCFISVGLQETPSTVT